MKKSLSVSVAVAALLTTLAANAQPTLSGAVVFSTDRLGSASGGQVWDTLGGAYWNLYVVQGAAGGTFVNSGDGGTTSISIPLAMGANAFTVYGARVAEAEIRQGDYSNQTVSYLGLNLFFDGDGGNPKISVFGADGVGGGTATGGTTYQLGSSTVAGANTLSFVRGVYRVTLSSFLYQSDVAGSDRVQPFNSTPDGVDDNLVTFTLTVELVPPVPVLTMAGIAALALLMACAGLLARDTTLATLWIIVLAVAATAPALFGSHSLGPEAVLDSDVLYARGTLPGRPAVWDPSRTYYDVPRDFAAADGFQHGRFDLWNPHVGFGQSLWAEGGALFFPAKVPFYLAPSLRTYDLAGALRLVIAGLGAFLFARRRGLGPVPAVAAASLFELSGAIVATLQFGSASPPCLLPWVLLGVEAIAQGRRLATAAATGLTLTAAACGGHPVLVIVVFAGFGAAIAGHVLAAWRRPRMALAIGALAVLSVALALALAAPVLLPLLEAQQMGRLYKPTQIYEEQLVWYRAQTRYALPVALFAPASLNGLRADGSLPFAYSLLPPAVGLLGLVLAVAGLLRGGLDTALIAVGLLGVGLTLAPPGLGLVGNLPFLHWVYPMYAWTLVALPASQAAGRGVELLSMRRGRWTVLAALAVVLAGATSLISLKDVPAMVLPLRQFFVTSLSDWTVGLRLVLPLALLPLVVVVLVIGTGTRFGNYCALAAAVLAALELVVSVAPATWFPDSAVLGSPASPAVRFLQQRLDGGRYRMLGWPRTLGHPATPSLFGLADLRGMAALPVERYVRYLEAISPQASWYVWQLPGDVLRHPLLDLAAVRYVVRPLVSGSEPLLQGDAALSLVYRDDHVAIYENNAALPRARIVHGAVPVRREEVFQRLVEAAGSSAHVAATSLANRIFVEPSSDGHIPPEALAMSTITSEYVQIMSEDDPDEVELQASLSQPGWVVLADTFYPGWTATIDGVPTSIHPANLVFRAVFVQPGTHRIRFSYQPTPRWALALSVAALAVSGFLLIRRPSA